MFEKRKDFPLFRLCERFGELLIEQSHFFKKSKQSCDTKYQNGVFHTAFKIMKEEVKDSADKYGLSKDFLDYLDSLWDNRAKLLTFSVTKDGEYKLCKAPEWYKVAYWYTRRENAYIAKVQYNCNWSQEYNSLEYKLQLGKKDNIWCKAEEQLQEISKKE